MNKSKFLNGQRTEPVIPTGIIDDNIIQVKANKGKFDPDIFTLLHNDSIILSVEAIDRDYFFDLPEFKIYEKLTKGMKSAVKIEGLGVGKYRFSCSETCTGIVEVESESDEKD